MADAPSRKVFVNLPVADLDESVRFFTQLGFRFDPRFTDDGSTCMILSDEAFVMLLVRDRFKGFAGKDVVDTSSGAEVIVALSAESREDVDDLVGRALAAGGRPSNDKTDLGFMYGWSFQDLDGHLWEVIHMDPSALEEQVR